MGPTNRPKSPATILEARGSIGMQRYILCRLQRLIVTERVTLNMFNITCYVTIRTGMRSIPVTECLRPNPLQPQARAIECPTRPFGAPRWEPDDRKRVRSRRVGHSIASGRTHCGGHQWKIARFDRKRDESFISSRCGFGRRHRNLLQEFETSYGSSAAPRNA